MILWSRSLMAKFFVRQEVAARAKRRNFYISATLRAYLRWLLVV